MVVGLFVCLIPTIFPEVDPKAEKGRKGSHGVSAVLWPIIFMLGFVSYSLHSAVANDIHAWICKL